MNAKYYMYRNLHTGGFSIKHLGKVCERSQFVVMHRVTFKVNKGGQERVRKEKAKNVHAYVVADRYTVNKNYMWKPSDFRRVTYNPYTDDTFVDAETGEAITESSMVIATQGRVYAK